MRGCCRNQIIANRLPSVGLVLEPCPGLRRHGPRSGPTGSHWILWATAPCTLHIFASASGHRRLPDRRRLPSDSVGTRFPCSGVLRARDLMRSFGVSFPQQSPLSWVLPSRRPRYLWVPFQPGVQSAICGPHPTSGLRANTFKRKVQGAVAQALMVFFGGSSSTSTVGCQRSR